MMAKILALAVLLALVLVPEAVAQDVGDEGEEGTPANECCNAAEGYTCTNSVVSDHARCADEECGPGDFNEVDEAGQPVLDEHGNPVPGVCCTAECGAAAHHEVAKEKDRDVALCIVTALILFGVFFEQVVLKAIKNAAKGGLEPIADALISEICMLGVIAMLLFVFAHKMDVVGDLSVSIFGNDEHLIHSLENIHFVMFFIMMVLLTETIFLVWHAHHQCHKWEKTNELCMENEDEIVADYVKAQKNPWKRMMGSAEADAMRFLTFRRRFVTSHDKSLKIPHNFEFNDYISNISGETIGECVEIPLFSWFMIWVVAIIFWGIVRDFEYVENFAIAYVIIGFAFSLMIIVMYHHLENVQKQLMTKTLYDKAEQLSAGGGMQGADELKKNVSMNVMAGEDEAGALIREKQATYEKKESEPTAVDEPPYLTDPTFSPKQSMMSRVLCCTCCREEEPQTRHVSLFWFGEEGPEFILSMIRLSLVFCALYIGYFAAGMYPKLVDGLAEDEAAASGLTFSTACVSHDAGRLRMLLEAQDEHGHAPVYNEHHHCIAYCPEGHDASQMFKDKWQVYLLIAGAVLPVLTLFAYLPKTIDGLVYTTSVEMMKRRAVIAEVRREMGTKKAIRAMKLLRMMKASSKARKPRDAGAPKASTLLSPEKHERVKNDVKEMFDMFDTDKSGQIDADELFDLLKMMNIEDTKEGANLVLKEIDVDNSMCVDFDEFFEWYAATLVGEGEEHDDIDTYVHDMFEMLKTGEEQEVSKEAFFSAMHKIGGGLSDDDISGIMSEIDKDQDGTIDEEELREFIKTHMANF